MIANDRQISVAAFAFAFAFGMLGVGGLFALVMQPTTKIVETDEQMHARGVELLKAEIARQKLEKAREIPTNVK